MMAITRRTIELIKNRAEGLKQIDARFAAWSQSDLEDYVLSLVCQELHEARSNRD